VKAFILAAGVGARLRPYTDTIPKPMLDVGGQPVIGYNLKMLANAGFHDIVLNLHYLPETITSYVGNGEKWGIRVSYSPEPALLGTAGALVPMADWLSEGTFAIVFGDNLVEIDLGAMLDVHRKARAVATVALWHREDVSNSGVADLAPDNTIEHFVEKPAAGTETSHWVNAGIVIAEPELLKYIPPSPCDLGRDVLPSLIAAGARVQGFKLAGGLWWFDRVEDYHRALADPALASFIASFGRDRAERSGGA
jgi:NDP-sugar pyrophosphorylase family protein